MKRKRRHGFPWGLALACAIMALMLAVFLPRALDRLRYPVKFEGEIRAACAIYGLPPALIAAMVNTESGYDPRARSPDGAMGLMQIMPDTGQWIADKLGEGGSFSDGMLYEPHNSLRYGCWYINFLFERYRGDELSAIAAYHAGQNAVDRWIAKQAEPVDALSGVPDDAPNTKHYVVKVLNAYEYYVDAYK